MKAVFALVLLVFGATVADSFAIAAGSITFSPPNPSAGQPFVANSTFTLLVPCIPAVRPTDISLDTGMVEIILWVNCGPPQGPETFQASTTVPGLPVGVYAVSVHLWLDLALNPPPEIDMATASVVVGVSPIPAMSPRAISLLVSLVIICAVVTLKLRAERA